jgi:acyl-CoA dehydrogenase
MAKVFVAEAVNRVVDRAVQLCGSLGISQDLPLGLFYREVRPFRIYDGASEVHRAAIARRVLRQARADTPVSSSNTSVSSSSVPSPSQEA